MMRARHFAHSVYVALKAATRKLVADGFGTQQMAAAATRVGQSEISDYASTAPANSERFMPVDVLLDLVAASGNTALLKFLAERADCLLVPLPVGRGGEVAERTGRTAKEFGDVMVRVGQALSDGEIVENEATEILIEIRELMVELSALAEAVKATQRGERTDG